MNAPEDFKTDDFCHLCFAEKSASVRLIRLAWKGLAQPGMHNPPMRLAVNQSEDDFFLCTDCIRQIKRLPFSSLVDSESPF